MAKRLGVFSTQRAAKRLCSLVTKFSTIIKITYPENSALHLALDAAVLACSALDTELEAVREYGD